MNWTGQYECGGVCGRKNLSSVEFSSKALQKLRGKSKKRPKCKQCVHDAALAEQKAAAAKMAGIMSSGDAKRLNLLEVQTQQTVPSPTLVECTRCKKKLPEIDFNRTQLNKKGGKRHCRACIQLISEDDIRTLDYMRDRKLSKLRVEKEITKSRKDGMKKELTSMLSSQQVLHEHKPNETKEDRAAFYRAKAKAAQSNEDEPQRKPNETKEDQAAFYRAKAKTAQSNEDEPQRKPNETKEDRAAFYRAKAKAVQSGADKDAVLHTPVFKTQNRKRSIDQVATDGEKGTSAHDNKRYIKHFEITSGKTNGQNTKKTF